MFQSKHAFTFYLDRLQNSGGRYHWHPFSETQFEIRNNSGKVEFGKCLVVEDRLIKPVKCLVIIIVLNSSSLGRKRPRMRCLRHVYYVFGLDNLNCPKALVQILPKITLRANLKVSL